MTIRAWVFGVSLVWASGYGMVWADPNLSAQQAEAKKQRLELQQRIQVLQKNIETTQSSKKDVTVLLRDIETQISATDSQLHQLAQRQQQVKNHLDDLKKQITAQQIKQEQGQQQLANQLRAQYASGLSPWATLLSGNNPQQIQRELGYLAYVSKAQTDQVHALQQGLKQLEQLHVAEKSSQTELTQLVANTSKQKQQLEQQQTQRKTVLVQVENELKTQQQQAQTMVNNNERLGSLISGLEKEIAQQAELRRQAEVRRKAELKQQQAEAKQREAEEQRLYALAHTPAQPAVATPPPPPPPPPPVKVAPKPPPAVEPTGGFTGLRKGLQPPVKGEVQGRFGTERPEGGPWRGIILRAAAGTPVKAIAAGRVIYAGWMAGFGNLLIVDHGASYLSVYGHNQSVLKQVGDVVAAGDVVARVGATGGQIEPGVYFEIRQNSQPVNPQLWLVN